MKNLFLKNNDFKTDYKKRPFDSYKSVVDKLDEETKKKLDRQRTIGMLLIVAFVVLLIVILAVTGIGVDKNVSVSGNYFVDKEKVLIECFGDSMTEGYTVTSSGDTASSELVEISYPEQLQKKLTELFADDGRTYSFKSIDVKNYGQTGSELQNTSCSRLSGSADIVLILYPANNFINGSNYEGTLEANIQTIGTYGAQVFLLNYPVFEGSEYEDKIAQANNYISATAKSYNLPLIDLNSYFAELTDPSRDEIFAEDQVHLTQDGYILMGDYVAQAIYDHYYNMY